MGGEASGGGLTLPALEFWRREKKRGIRNKEQDRGRVGRQKLKDPVAQPPAAWLGQRQPGAAATLQALVVQQGEQEAGGV
jgi:hypothetical protein